MRDYQVVDNRIPVHVDLGQHRNDYIRKQRHASILQELDVVLIRDGNLGHHHSDRQQSRPQREWQSE